MFYTYIPGHEKDQWWPGNPKSKLLETGASFDLELLCFTRPPFWFVCNTQEFLFCLRNLKVSFYFNKHMSHIICTVMYFRQSIHAVLWTCSLHLLDALFSWKKRKCEKKTKGGKELEWAETSKPWLTNWKISYITIFPCRTASQKPVLCICGFQQ